MSVICGSPHPKTGALCIKEEGHINDQDARVQQHLAAGNLKWPTLHELDPNEGFNDYVTRL
jgi:hypothetical protein